MRFLNERRQNYNELGDKVDSFCEDCEKKWFPFSFLWWDDNKKNVADIERKDNGILVIDKILSVISSILSSIKDIYERIDIIEPPIISEKTVELVNNYLEVGVTADDKQEDLNIAIYENYINLKNTKVDKPLIESTSDSLKIVALNAQGESVYVLSNGIGKVKSVNGMTGDVVLKTSNLENDSDYTTNSKLNKEVQDRTAQINGVEQKIQTEKTERISEDNILDGKITIEEAERINADGLKLDKPLENATDQYVILGDGTTSPKSDFGKVNTVNDIPPDENKNVNIGLNDTLKIGNETDKTISFLQSTETDDHQMHLDAIRGIDISKSEINSYDSYRNININYKGISLLGDTEIGSGIMLLGLNEDLNQYEVKLTSRYNGRKLDFGFIDKIGSSYYGFSNTNGSYKIVPKNYDPVGNYTATLPDKSGIIAFTSDIQSPTIGSINPTTDTTLLAEGLYNTQISGIYPNAGNIIVKEGYYTLLRKTGDVWSLESEVKMPTLSPTGKVEEGNTEAVSGGEVYDYVKDDLALKADQADLVQLTGKVDDIFQSEEIQRHTSYETGFCIYRGSGNLGENPTMKVSPFTPISNNDAIRIKGYDSNQTDNSAICVFYDIYKKGISTYYSGTKGVVTITIPPEEIPQGAKYIRSTALVETEDAYVQTSISNTINKIDAQIKEGKVHNYVLAQQLEVKESSNAIGWYFSKPIPRLNIKQITVEGSFNDSLAITYYGYLNNVVKETNGVGSSVHTQIITDDVPDDCFYFITRSGFSLPVITISEIGSNNEAELRERENVIGIFNNYTSILNQNISDASDVGGGWYKTTLLPIPDNCKLKYEGRTRAGDTAIEFFNVFKTSIKVVQGSGSATTPKTVIDVIPPKGAAFVQASYINGAGSLIISEKGKSSFINNSSAEDFVKKASTRQYRNNLINEPDTILSSINYGQPNASHTLRIDSTARRICFDLILPKSINKTSPRKKIITVRTVDGEWTPLDIEAVYSTPYQEKRESKPQDTRTTWSPFPTSRSGIIAMDYYYQDRQAHNNRDSLGDRVFSMWLKGVSSSTNEPTKEEVISRSESLESIQDMYIEIADDTFTIGRDGIGEDDSIFNGGVTSTIFTTSLKDNGEYKTAIALYEEITTANLTDFNVKFFALTDGLSCADIIQYGKFKLVGKFSQISGRGETEELLYDSFPLFIFATNREIRLTVDFIIPKEGSPTAYVNGKKIVTTAFSNIKPIDFTINQAMTGCRVENLEVFYNNLGGAEIIGNNIASERTPLIFGLMGHVLADNYKNASALTTNVPKMIALATRLREKGYNMLSADDLSAYYNGYKKLPAKNAFIITDDYRLMEWMYSNTDVRSSFHQMGLKIIFAMVIDSCINNNLDKNLILSAIQNGCSFVSHSYYHDVPMNRKSSISFYYELLNAREYMNENYFNQNIFVYPWHGGYRAQEVMLEYSGYSVAVDSGNGTQSIAHNSKFSNPFRINRFDISDGSVMPQF